MIDESRAIAARPCEEHAIKRELVLDAIDASWANREQLEEKERRLKAYMKMTQRLNAAKKLFKLTQDELLRRGKGGEERGRGGGRGRGKEGGRRKEELRKVHTDIDSARESYTVGEGVGREGQGKRDVDARR